MLGTSELLIIAAVIVLVFGAAKLPKLARGIKEARTELTDLKK